MNTATKAVIATVTVGTGPESAAVTPDGARAYIANTNSNNVSVINTSTNIVLATIPVGTDPFGIAISPDGTKAYVTNTGGHNVSVIDTSTKKVTATVPVGNSPSGVAVTPDGTKVYVVNQIMSGTVSVIDTSTKKVSATVPVGSNPYGVAITPDGTKAYVSNYTSNSLSVIDTSTDKVSVTPTVGSPTCLTITPDGTAVYLTILTAQHVLVIDTSSNTVTATIGVGSDPLGVAITPDGTQAYVINGSSKTVSVIDTSTYKVTATVSVGSSPESLGQFIQPASVPMTTIPYAAPQGRLTLTSNTPVMTANATALTSVYYTPYQGNVIPIYDGANMQSYALTGELTMTLSTTNQTSGNIYDLFVFLNSSVVTIGAGPAWSSSSSRGSGAGTTGLQQIDGLWVNANSITLKNGSTSYSSIAAGEATYVGSIYMIANGETSMEFNPAAASGGSTNNVLGVYNAYNRVTTIAIVSDSKASWTYTGTSWRAADNSSNNRISFIDGLQQSSIRATYAIEASSSAAGVQGAIGVNLDSTSATPVNPIGFAESTSQQSLTAYGRFLPQLGLHYAQAVEYASGATVTFESNGSAFMGLMLELEM
jgi:YVTN family beta-propeller protein